MAGKSVLKACSSASNGSGWINPSFDDFDFAPKPKTSVRSKTSPVREKRRRRSSDDCIILPGPSAANDTDLWTLKYQPLSNAELVVHKKKVTEVQNWLEMCFLGKLKRSPFLLLTGPAGCGKTATVQVLSREMDFEIMEWSNPLDEAASTMDSSTGSDMMNRHTSQTQQFQDFLLRSNKFTSLQFQNSECASKKVILLEEFPNVFMRDPLSFHNILRTYRSKGNNAVVFIVSEGEGNDSALRILFPANVQAELGIANISFNPVAPTSLSKLLSKILTQETSRSQKMSSSQLKQVVDGVAESSSGDVRTAINTLQFMTYKDSTKRTKKSSLPSSKSKPSASDVKVDVAIGSRDNSMFLFRSLGKILYCKRSEPSTNASQCHLPQHLSHHHRDPLQFIPEVVLEKTNVSGDFFTTFLHQNYIDFYQNIEDIVMASEYLSDSDYLTTDWTSRTVLTDYAASVAARGIAFSNTSRATVSGAKSTNLGWKPLHKPEWFSITKKTRENTASVAGLFRTIRLPTRELQTQHLPYLYKLKVPLSNPAQVALLNYLGLYKRVVRREALERLDDKEVTLNGDEDCDSKVPVENQDPDVKLEDECLLSKDEEVVIDDFDDDW